MRIGSMPARKYPLPIDDTFLDQRRDPGGGQMNPADSRVEQSWDLLVRTSEPNDGRRVIRRFGDFAAGRDHGSCDLFGGVGAATKGSLGADINARGRGLHFVSRRIDRGKVV